MMKSVSSDVSSVIARARFGDQPHSKTKRCSAALAALALVVFAPLGHTQSRSISPILSTGTQAQVLPESTLGAGGGRYAGDIYTITLLWYLEWIRQILDNAIDELDALDSAEVWMADTENVYTANGIPILSSADEQKFLITISNVETHLDSAPESISASAITHFRGVLADMEADILAARRP